MRGGEDSFLLTGVAFFYSYQGRKEKKNAQLLYRREKAISSRVAEKKGAPSPCA